MATALATINRVLTDGLTEWGVPMGGQELTWHDLETVVDSHRDAINNKINSTTTDRSVKAAWRRMINVCSLVVDGELIRL